MALRRFLCLLVLSFSVVPAQTPDEVEKRIASLPSDQRIFERFRLWIAAQPTTVRGSSGISEQLRDATLLEKYRTYLKERGFSDADISAQFEVLRQEGNRLEAVRWNRILTAEHPTFNAKPNQFLVEMVKGRKPGRALDIAMGQGRNSIWLAQQGWDVTGFDIADAGLAMANENARRLGVKIHTEVARFENFDYGENRWDLILRSYAGCGAVAEKLERALKPGGILVEEAFHVDATKDHRIGGSICGTGELPYLFQELRTIHYEEPIATPDFAQEPMRIVRYCAEKPSN
ncbi:MAG TPA: class I SAM-dependent methyltransferase [Dongiaceae bacterium]|nr:class I SAM-dependent methyltransferase [Dongiaceae bacterium]